MKKSVMLILSIVFLVGIVSASCGLGDGDDSQLIMRLYQESNSHGALWNDTHGYNVEICSPNSETVDHSSNPMLYLSDTYNSHISTTSSDTYDTPVYFGDELDCDYSTDCSGLGDDYSCVVTYESENNSHLANCSGTNYTNKICCKTATEITDAYWADMTEAEISGGGEVDLNDSVKMIVPGEGLEDKMINYSIYKKCDGLIDCALELIFGKEEESQFSTKGYARWRAGTSEDGSLDGGTYYFEAEVVGIEGTQNSSDLVVLDEVDNSPPEAEIVSPGVGEVYYVGEEIWFNQTSEDEDDFINYTWEFGDSDGNTAEGSTEDYNNYNLKHSYSKTGQKQIKLFVEDERGLTARDRTSILIIDPSANEKYIFAHVDNPEWGESVVGTNISFNAESTFALETSSGGSIDCLGGDCPSETNNGTTINDNGMQGNYSDIKFSWIFDDGETYTAYGNAGKDFIKYFPRLGSHWADLTVKINPESSTETEFSNYLTMDCRVEEVEEVSQHHYFYNESGARHDPETEGGYCNTSWSLGQSMCCDRGFSCQENGTDYFCLLSPNDKSYTVCDDYNDSVNCSDDPYNIASSQVGTSCGLTINSKELCGSEYFTSAESDCQCVWDNRSTSDTSDDKCVHESKIQETIVVGGSEIPVTHFCRKSIEHGECINNLMNIKVNATMEWDNETINNLTGSGIAANESDAIEFLNEECSSLCSSEDAIVGCGADRIKLSFFSIINIILIVVVLVVVYFIMAGRGKKDKRKKGKKSKKKK